MNPWSSDINESKDQKTTIHCIRKPMIFWSDGIMNQRNKAPLNQGDKGNMNQWINPSTEESRNQGKNESMPENIWTLLGLSWEPQTSSAHFAVSGNYNCMGSWRKGRKVKGPFLGEFEIHQQLSGFYRNENPLAAPGVDRSKNPPAGVGVDRSKNPPAALGVDRSKDPPLDNPRRLFIAPTCNSVHFSICELSASEIRRVTQLAPIALIIYENHFQFMHLGWLLSFGIISFLFAGCSFYIGLEITFFVFCEKLFTRARIKDSMNARLSQHHPRGTRAQPAGVASKHPPTVPEWQPRMFPPALTDLKFFPVSLFCKGAYQSPGFQRHDPPLLNRGG